MVILFLLTTIGCTSGAKTDAYPYPSPPTPIASNSYPSPQIIIRTPFYQITPTWNNPIHLKYGETVILNDGFQITFSDVIEDTRCLTTETNCLPEGNAKIRLIIQYAPGMEGEFLLNTYPKFTSGWINGHVIELNKIKPDLPGALPLESTNYEIWIMIRLI